MDKGIIVGKHFVLLARGNLWRSDESIIKRKFLGKASESSVKAPSLRTGIIIKAKRKLRHT